MHIQITDQTKIGSIQEAFQQFYPHLRIEFYRLPHPIYTLSDNRLKLSPELPVGAIKKTHTDFILEIQPTQKVKEVEMEIEYKLGLGAQLFRQCKGGWLQTTGEDDFSVKDLNLYGRNANDDYILEEEDIDPGEEKPDKLF